MHENLLDFGYDRSLPFCAVTLELVEFFLHWHENELLMALIDEKIMKEIFQGTAHAPWFAVSQHQLLGDKFTK